MDPQTIERIDEAERDFFERIQSLICPPPSVIVNSGQTIRTVCGVDASYSTTDNKVVAAAVVFEDGQLEETSIYSGRFTYPYVSGLFFLHEGPFVVAAVKKLKKKIPQLVCFDAHGMAHPRMKGLATICGMVLQIPSIGIAKTTMVGELAPHRSGLLSLEFEGEKVGYLTVEPKRYWSPGYSVSMETLEDIISQKGDICLKALGEAHKLSKKELGPL
jgi:deoxyribonuclease V